jgi:hypothetical protein
VPAKGKDRRSFSAVKEFMEIPGGFLEVKATENGTVQVVLSVGYILESMHRGGPTSTGSTILTLVPDKKVKA